jgi:hypothetical protein
MGSHTQPDGQDDGQGEPQPRLDWTTIALAVLAVAVIAALFALAGPLTLQFL